MTSKDDLEVFFKKVKKVASNFQVLERRRLMGEVINAAKQEERDNMSKVAKTLQTLYRHNCYLFLREMHKYDNIYSIAGALGMSQVEASTIVKSLVDAGLIVSVRSSENARERTCVPTDKLMRYAEVIKRFSEKEKNSE